VVEDDLVAFVTELCRVTEFPGRAAALRGTTAEAQLDPDVARRVGAGSAPAGRWSW